MVIPSNKVKIDNQRFYWMQVSRGNILKTTGMLCNPNFVNKRIMCILV